MARWQQQSYSQVDTWQATSQHSNSSHEWWTVAKINGYPQRVYCQAQTAFEASNIFKSLYGDALVNSFATRV